LSQQWYRGPLSRIAMMTLPIGLAAAGLTTLVAAPAQAVNLHSKVLYAASTGRLTYTAAASGDAANQVYVDIDSTGGFTITDKGSLIDLTVSSAEVCTRLAGNALRCVIPALSSFHAVLGDGDDRWEQYYPVVPSTVEGGKGNDVLYGGEAVDNITGGPGDDDIRGFRGDDNLYGDDGNDELHGNADADNLYGDSGDDKIHGESGSDKAYGGTGFDYLYGEYGNDLLDGGDEYSTIAGGPGNDTIKSSYGVLRGGDGNDKITGYGDNYGDNGDDVLTAGSETFGGDGNDTLDLSGRGSAYRVSLDNQTNDRYLPICDDWIGCPVVAEQNAHDDLEIVLGTAYNDEITGNIKVNDLRGGGGNDKLWGLGGEDKLDAQAGNNQHLDGGNDIDSCFGAGTLFYTSCEIR